MKLDRAAIERLIPHQGAMCLLHEVLEADAERILCRAVNHRDPAHPLREQSLLPALCGIEYAAQAMAVHGAITGGGAARAGVLAVLRNVAVRVERLDDIAADLLVAARKLGGAAGGLIYEFELHAGSRELLRGRATVIQGEALAK